MKTDLEALFESAMDLALSALHFNRSDAVKAALADAGARRVSNLAGSPLGLLKFYNSLSDKLEEEVEP